MQSITSYKPKEKKNLVTLNSRDLSASYYKDFKKKFSFSSLQSSAGHLCAGHNLLSRSPQPCENCCERISKKQPEIYLAFSNLEVLVGFAKGVGAGVELVWIEELVEVKKWDGKWRQFLV